MNDLEFSVKSCVGLMTKEPFLDVTFGETKVKLSVPKAREIAMLLLECAEAAASDCAVVAFFVDQVGMPLEQAAANLMSLRKHRADMREQG